ncbi:hypothetical protein [Pseudomonas svalbardensis]|uniref:hypothetical protein n=1 Tax=Pseudomonas svalbardensis TaxID=3042029 RepID=UPI0024B3442C|nr:hypothetical protein [Pseudomonas sp. PMCC200367]
MQVEGYMGFKKLSGMIFVSVLAVAGMQGCSDKADSKNLVVSNDCWIDAINENTNSIVAVKPGSLSLRGWAADSSTGTAPKEMGVYIVDNKGAKVLFKTDKRVLRTDVAAEKKQPKYEMSGFDFLADAGSLAVGEYTLSVVMYRDGATVACATPTKLVVK